MKETKKKREGKMKTICASSITYHSASQVIPWWANICSFKSGI